MCYNVIEVFMEYDSLLDRAEVFFATATIAAHASAVGDTFSSVAGFRQKDAKFLIDLFSNWTQSLELSPSLPVQNTQIARYLEYLVKNGYARRVTRQTRPLYRLTRTGLIELLSRLVHKTYTSERERFFFVFYFVKNYAARIEGLVKAEGKEFPYALKLELENLFDTGSFIKREVEAAEKALKRLDARIQDGIKSSDLIATGLKARRDIDELVKEVESRYPYELNSQKPLSELIASIPQNIRTWELNEGNKLRVTELWQPTRVLLKAYIEEVKRLKS